MKSDPRIEAVALRPVLPVLCSPAVPALTTPYALPAFPPGGTLKEKS